MAVCDVLTRLAAANEHAPLASRENLQLKIHLVPSGAAPDGKQHGLSARQDLWPAMADFTLAPIELGDGFRHADAHADLPDTGEIRRCVKDRVAGGPTPAEADRHI